MKSQADGERFQKGFTKPIECKTRCRGTSTFIMVIVVFWIWERNNLNYAYTMLGSELAIVVQERDLGVTKLMVFRELATIKHWQPKSQ